MMSRFAMLRASRSCTYFLQPVAGSETSDLAEPDYGSQGALRSARGAAVLGGRGDWEGS